MSSRKNTNKTAASDSASDADLPQKAQPQQQQQQRAKKQTSAIEPAQSSKFPWAVAALAILGCVYMFSNQGQDRTVTRQTRSPTDPQVTECASGKFSSLAGTAALDGWCQANCNNPGSPYCPKSTCKCAAASQNVPCQGNTVCPKNNYIAITGTGATDKWCHDSCTNPGAPSCPCTMCACAPLDPSAILDAGWQHADLDTTPNSWTPTPSTTTVKYASAGNVKLSITDEQAPAANRDMLHIKLDGTQLFDTTPGTGTGGWCYSPDECFADPDFSHGSRVLPAGQHTLTFVSFNLLGAGTYAYRLDSVDCPAGDYIISKSNAPVKFDTAAVACPAGYAFADIADGNWTPIATAMTTCFGQRQGAWVKSYNGDTATCMSITSGDGSVGSKGSVNQVPCGTYLPVVCKKI